MKIYPSRHAIRITDTPRFLDIPLAHVEKELHPKKVHVKLEDTVAENKMCYLAPYQKFSSDDFLIFDDEGNIAPDVLLKQNNTFIYKPLNKVEFTPKTFTTSALVKRNDMLSENRNYDFRVGVYKNGGDAKSFTQKLMGICGDANYRRLAPANITVNGGNTSVAAMLTDLNEEKDFVFIQGFNEEFLYNGRKVIPYDSFFRTHTNIWVTLRDEGSLKMFSEIPEETAEYEVSHKTCIDSDSRYKNSPPHMFTTKTYKYKANKGYIPKNLTDVNAVPVLTNDPICPIQVYEKPNGSYVIFSNETLFDNLDKYGKFVYEVMRAVYEKSYVATNLRDAWITDSNIDYMGSLDVPFRRKHPVINLHEMVLEKDRTIGQYEIRSVETSRPGIICEGIDSSGNIKFSKITADDPSIEPGSITVFTSKRTILAFSGQKYKIVESAVNISTSINDDKCYVTVSPFSSSKNKLVLKNMASFEIKDLDKEYALYALPVSVPGQESYLFVKEVDSPNQLEGAVKLATVYVECEGSPIATDIRTLGGGIPVTENDYDMLDIGNILGRPYRTGVGAVITLPKSMEKYDARIRDAIEKYKVAADEFFILYE